MVALGGRLLLAGIVLSQPVRPVSEGGVGQGVLVALFAVTVLATLSLLRDLTSQRMPKDSALLVQAIVDVLLVSLLVAVMGGEATPLAAIYVALVTIYALVLPLGRALIAVAFAAASYVLVAIGAGEGQPIEFWTQVGVIAGIGGLIAVLGRRLADAAAKQSALAHALEQVRLEADEILATIQSGVMTVDGEGKLGYINPRARRILGATDEGGGEFVAGTPVLETLRGRSRDLHAAIERGIRTGTRVTRGEAAVRRADGSLFPVGLSTTTFLRPGSNRPSVTAIFADISDLRQLQEFRLRAERLEAVAALSASLAHEIRNPLAAIRSAVEQLASTAGADSDDQVLATLVMRESERLNRLLSEFLDFSRVRATQCEVLDLLTLAQEVAAVLSEHPETRGTTFAVEGESMPLEGDGDLLHRIVSNLALNAAQVLAGRGTVTIGVGPTRSGDAPVGLIDRRVKLTVRDDGPGIPEDIRDRLFEPFVTGRRGGSGLGLAIVQRAVASHRGIILVDTAPGAGTTFSIFLPATMDREDGV
jgi:two-component system sensor histidine kinase PilS (NtrC family)